MSSKNQVKEKLLQCAYKMASNKYLIAIRNGVTLSMPLIIVGSLFMIIASFPIPGWEEFVGKIGLSGYLWKAVDSSFGLIGLVSSFGVAYSLAKENKVDGVSAGIISLSAFIMATPFLSSDGGAGIPVGFMGSKGLFVGMILGLINASIFTWFIKRDIQIKMPDSVPPAVAKSFSALIPGFAIITLWVVVYALIDRLGLGNIHNIIGDILRVPLGLLGGNIFGTLFAISLNSLFWFVGIHGGNIVNAIMNPIYLVSTDANRLAFQAGEKLPNIITQPFIDNFVYMGGGGATIGLVITIALLARRKKASSITKTLSPLTLIPGLFNINEPAIFGIPIVMNIRLLIPFILAPMINAVITYVSMAIGLVPLTIGVVIPWTMPPIISGFLATGSIMGSILQLVCIIVDVLIYYYFYIGIEKDNLKLEDEK